MAKNQRSRTLTIFGPGIDELLPPLLVREILWTGRLFLSIIYPREVADETFRPVLGITPIAGLTERFSHEYAPRNNLLHVHNVHKDLWK